MQVLYIFLINWAFSVYVSYKSYAVNLLLVSALVGVIDMYVIQVENNSVRNHRLYCIKILLNVRRNTNRLKD